MLPDKPSATSGLSAEVANIGKRLRAHADAINASAQPGEYPAHAMDAQVMREAAVLLEDLLGANDRLAASESAGAIRAHSKTEYKRLKEQGVDVLPPSAAPQASGAETVRREATPAAAAPSAPSAAARTPKELIETVRAVLSATKHGAGPVAVVVNNNQPGTQHIIETAPNVTLDVGTKLYAAPSDSSARTMPDEIADMLEALLDYQQDSPSGAWCRVSRQAVDEAADFIRRHYAASSARLATDETGWLIENGKQGDEMRYRNFEQGIPMWTKDHNEALRFARRVDAEKFAAEDEDAWRVVEHMWSDAGTSHPYCPRCKQPAPSMSGCAADDCAVKPSARAAEGVAPRHVDAEVGKYPMDGHSLLAILRGIRDDEDRGVDKDRRRGATYAVDRCFWAVESWLRSSACSATGEKGPADAWLIERSDGSKDVVLSPLTDDTPLMEGDEAWPLYRETE